MTGMSFTGLELFGTDEPVPENRLLRAGGLTAELQAGNLRNVRFDGDEVLRAIAYVVRDRDWGTYSPALDGFAVEETASGFSVRYTARCTGPQGQNLRYDATIKGEQGRLVFDVLATPDADFETNRCGFCILHPIRNLAGRPVVVEHTDGTVEQASLPAEIEPWQPFKTMRTIAHTVRPGLLARCRMDGDDFEMEDQRNWTDASFKTYVRPIERPWPYTLPAHVSQRQTITLTLEGDRTLRGQADGMKTVTIDIGGAIGPMPGFALVVTPEEASAVVEQAAALRTVAPQTLIFHLDPTAGHGLKALQAFAAVQALHPSEAVLEIVLPCQDSPAEELTTLATAVRSAELRLDALVVSPAPDRRSTPPGSAWPACPPLDEVYAAARGAFPGIRLGGGMISNFTELNRKRPPLGQIDFVTHCTNPIVHAADDRSVMETLEALPFVTASVRAIVGDLPYRIGPTTIGMRHNPYGSRVLPNPENRRVAMADRDPRQAGRFAAAWLLGYAAQTAEGRLESFCGGALTGVFGLLGSDARPRPIFRAAHALSRIAGQPRLLVTSSHPDRVLGVATLASDGGTTLWVANITAEPQTVRLGAAASVTLPPFAVEEHPVKHRVPGASRTM